MWEGEVLKALLLRHRFDIVSITLGIENLVRLSLTMALQKLRFLKKIRKGVVSLMTELDRLK